MHIYNLVFIAGLMGLMEKRRFRNFVIWSNDFNESDPSTHKGICKYMQTCSLPMYPLQNTLKMHG